MNILIVEDDILIANHIKRCIEKENLGIAVIAKNYNEAVQRLESNNDFNLIFLDVNFMGNKNGIDLARFINERHGIPFLFVTSYTDAATLNELQETNPEAYISKPFNNADIIATVSIIRNRLRASKLFSLNIGKMIYNINLDNLMYAKSDHVYIDLVFKNDTITIRSTVSDLLTKLPHGALTQINRSVAVNPKFVTLSTATSVIMDNIIFKKSSKYN